MMLQGKTPWKDPWYAGVCGVFPLDIIDSSLCTYFSYNQDIFKLFKVQFNTFLPQKYHYLPVKSTIDIDGELLKTLRH